MGLGPWCENGNGLQVIVEDPEMVIRHQRYKGVPDDVSNTSLLRHKRIAFLLFFHSEFNKFTDRMLEKRSKKTQIIKTHHGHQPFDRTPEHRFKSII
jgi:hypothetical protein